MPINGVTINNIREYRVNDSNMDELLKFLDEKGCRLPDRERQEDAICSQDCVGEICIEKMKL